VDDVLAAEEGIRPLPERAIMLTFDDAYKSFREFVYPMLKEYQIPCVLSVVSGWIDSRPENVRQELMTWEELREVAGSGLVEIASHTHKLHRGVVYNPQGNEAAATANRRYNRESGTYETEEEFRRRLKKDLLASREALETRLGVEIRVLTWPYGKYSLIGLEEARAAGFRMALALNDETATIDRLLEVKRYLVYKNPTLIELLKDLKIKRSGPAHERIVQADLDLIYDPSPEETEKNLSAFLDRMAELKPGKIYLQAFADPEGTGDIESVYFPNRVLPMRMDLLNRVVHQLKTRVEVEVYAWMPMLSIVLPDAEKNDALRVREFKAGSVSPSSSWYRRLSPFDPETRAVLKTLYEDMAVHTWIDGVVFQDDGYLNDYEDFHPAALAVYREIAGSVMPPDELPEEKAEEWARIKTKTLIELTGELREAVRRHRPETKFARTVYAPVVIEPGSEKWLAQNYSAFLEAYDYVVVMAYPRMEEVRHPKKWLKDIVRTARLHPEGTEKTVFKVQTFDWKEDRWIETKTVRKWLRVLVAAGARHVAYYPDDYTRDRPEAGTVRAIISAEDFPFKRY
jgi:biofilm PGA synthesis lipoprotein PgaB